MRYLLAVTLALAGCTPAEPAMPLGTTSESCGACHTEQHAEWAGSPHARGGSSEVFEALLPRVEEAWGAQARDACVRCHSPGHGGDEAIGCVSCHAAIGNTAERSGQLVVDLDRPVAGPFGDLGPDAPHGSRSGELLASPSLCGTCHEVLGPGLFEEPTLTEWRASGLGEIGADCARCHLPDADPAPIALGSTRVRPRRSHAIAGFDAARLDEALSLYFEERVGGVSVILENAGAGHEVPSGVSFLRDVWVDVRVIDPDESVHDYPRVIELGARLYRGDEEVALITDADRVERHGLALGEHVSFDLDVPESARVEAVLRGRAVRRDVLDRLGLAGDGDLAPFDVRRIER